MDSMNSKKVITFTYANNQDDYDSISHLATIIWNEHYTPIIGKEQVTYMLEKYQSASAIKKAILNDYYHYLMVYKKNQLIGYSAYYIIGNSLFLSKFYVHKPFRGLKVSSLMMKQIILYAKENKLSSVYLTVNKYNKHSIAIYEHFGFLITKELVTDIGQGYVMDDYQLTLNI